jgi:sulfatase maturation enzyme AslB (radical SAM superfamily)
MLSKIIMPKLRHGLHVLNAHIIVQEVALTSVEAIAREDPQAGKNKISCLHGAGCSNHYQGNINMESEKKRFSVDICVTHSCNLNCIYCYQKHDATKRISFSVARKIIDWIFENVPSGIDEVEIDFIGGEPLLEFELIRNISHYVINKKTSTPFILFATTNGTLLTKEMKAWFTEHKEYFWLGLSLDGNKDTHDHNRSNSFNMIDMDYFQENWPEQGVKMTLSEFSLHKLAENIKFIHEIGFSKVDGVNFFEGNFDWNKDAYIRLLVPQLSELVDFYLSNEQFKLNQMLDKHIEYCEIKNKSVQKWCGIGSEKRFFDIDGTMYPCTFITPMTFSQKELHDIMKTDFKNENNFFDEDCYKNCYIYPICPTCAGANYMVNKNFKKRNKSKCRIQKIVSLFIADLQGKLLLKNRAKINDTVAYYRIEAIKKIRELYLNEFKIFF